jgi:aryl-alcohol dehydrogenase-like predicted oxidoreductase
VERIDLYQFHWPDDAVPFEESVGALARLREEGKVRHVGLSNVSVDQLASARRIVPVLSVQNRFNLEDQASAPVLDACARDGIAFIPWDPLAVGKLTERQDNAITRTAARQRATPGQIALAWLLARSPVMLPIPGTGSLAHLEENCAAADVQLTDEQVDALTAAAG